MEEINLKDFWEYLKKYIIVMIVISVFVAGGTFIYDKILKKPVYTTYTTVVLVKADNSQATGTDAINQSDVLLNKNLVSTYSQIIKSKLVLSQVIRNLNLSYSVKELSRNIRVESLEDTEILKISVTDEKPERAADIANDIAKVFNAEITKIYKLNNVSVIDEASVSYDVSNNTLKKDVLIAIFISVFGVSALAFIKFYFDDSVKLSDNLEQEVGMPIIAKVPKENNTADIVVEERPNALTSESIRTLRTNLQFASVDKEIKTLLVTSTLPGEGKSFVSANLAASFAQTGKKVLLVDCDLRKGRQHRLFKIKNQKGLSNMLIGDPGKVKEYIQKTKVKDLYVITRGVCPPNPSELLNSKKNSALIDKLCDLYDIIIFDSAPCSGLSDSLILSSLVDKVVMVCSEEGTPKTELINARKAIENVGGSIVGCAVNNINLKGSGYGKYYYYYEEEE